MIRCSHSVVSIYSLYCTLRPCSFAPLRLGRIDGRRLSNFKTEIASSLYTKKNQVDRPSRSSQWHEVCICGFVEEEMLRRLSTYKVGLPIKRYANKCNKRRRALLSMTQDGRPVSLRSGHYEWCTTINRTATKSLALSGWDASSLVFRSWQ